MNFFEKLRFSTLFHEFCKIRKRDSLVDGKKIRQICYVWHVNFGKIIAAILTVEF